MFDHIEFANPELLWLLLIIPILAIWHFFRLRKLSPAINISDSSPVLAVKPTIRQRLRHILPIFRLIAIGLLVVVLARPQSKLSGKSVHTEGIDIVMALDVSTSMLAEDFKPNRIEAAKKTASEFIKMRENDRIGLVIFSGESFTQCPITIDHDVLLNMFSSIKSGMIEDGTAIGMGLATAVNRLKDSKAKSKVVILLTDGVNNTGFVAPETAADIAKTYGVRVYTIGVGTRGMAPYPAKFKTWGGQVVTKYQNIEVNIDEDVLKSIASITDGKYFRATNNKSLEKIYSEIDEMEKTRIFDSYYNKYNEEFLPFALLAAGLLLLEILLRYTWLRVLP